MRSPLLFIVFNRPDTTAAVFAAIRAARPPRLYVAADGPRATRAGEAERCAEVRRIASAVDWPCELRTLFRDANLGCRLGVSGAVSWFFECEPEGIILEDDVLPVPSFFEYCDLLLERYRHDQRVAMVSGCNLVSGRYTCRDSYFFSRYAHIWGWAGWRRSWRHYDVGMQAWPEWLASGGLDHITDGSWLAAAYWRHLLAKCHAGRIDTWDYQWAFACWRTGGLIALPSVNQTRNLGFGVDATHTTADEPAYVRSSPPRPLPLPLRHPADVQRDARADVLIATEVFGLTPLKLARGALARVLG